MMERLPAVICASRARMTSGCSSGFFAELSWEQSTRDGLRQASFGEKCLGLGDMGRRVVRAGGATTEDDVAVGVAAGDDGGGGAFDIDAEERLRLAGGFDGVDGGLEGAVGAVFEAERHREARGHLPVRLGFGGASTNRAPADEVGDILRGDRIEKFCRGGQAEVEDIAQEGAAEAETSGDVVGAVEVRIHHKALPADGGAGFFEIHAHHDQNTVGNFFESTASRRA